MKVLVKFGNQSYSFEVSETILVSDLKKLISQKIGVDTNSFALQFNAVYMLDDKPLSKYEVSNEATLMMISNLPGDMQISVKFANEIYSIDVTESTLVRDLKGKISKQTGDRKSDILLIYGGINLIDNEPLSKYHIDNDSTLLMIIKFRGLT